jgi:dCMP deaminase
VNPLKFMGVVQAIAAMSKDTTKVGALILDDDCNILSVGFNGMPRGVSDDVLERKERPEKYYWTSHAEENAIAQAARLGARLIGSTMLVSTLHPCTSCTRMIIQAGIKKVYAPLPTEGEHNKWYEEAKRSSQMFDEAGVVVEMY